MFIHLIGIHTERVKTEESVLPYFFCSLIYLRERASWKKAKQKRIGKMIKKSSDLL